MESMPSAEELLSRFALALNSKDRDRALGETIAELSEGDDELGRVLIDACQALMETPSDNDADTGALLLAAAKSLGNTNPLIASKVISVIAFS
jgi:hypothetical protein